MERKRFERLVAEAVDSLPSWFQKRIENLAVIVEQSPPRRRSSRASSSTLLGFYHGVPLKDRGSYYGNIPPDVIVIYQEPIERLSSSDDEIQQHVRDVVLHEIGHHFGLSEQELREIDNFKKGQKRRAL